MYIFPKNPTIVKFQNFKINFLHENLIFFGMDFFSTRYDPTDCIFSTHRARARFRFPPQRAPSMSQNA